MLLCVAGAPADAPARKQGLIANLLFVLLLPAIIYSLFILYGGQQRAYERRFGTPDFCPHCKKAVPGRDNPDGNADEELVDLKRICPHCSQTLV